MPLLSPTLYPTHPAKAQKVLDVLLTGVNQSVATTLRDPDDGEAGWTILDIVCHLRDFEQLWQRRVTLVLNEENPRFDPFDPDALVLQNDYANQDFAAVWAERAALRAVSIAMLDAMTDEQWDRSGLHARFGEITIVELKVQLPMHDLDHAEQIIRILGM